MLISYYLDNSLDQYVLIVFEQGIGWGDAECCSGILGERGKRWACGVLAWLHGEQEQDRAASVGEHIGQWGFTILYVLVLPFYIADGLVFICFIAYWQISLQYIFSLCITGGPKFFTCYESFK